MRIDRRSKIESGKGEGGYALVALLALMTVIALAALAAIPNLQRQAQRESEAEAIFRGEQMADAIKMYIDVSPNHQPPTSIDDLVQGVPRGSKKLQVIRQSALKDPLSKTGEWRLVIVNSPQIINFQSALIDFAGRPVDPVGRDPFLKCCAPPMQTVGISGLEGSKASADDSGDLDETATGPFIGVSSKSKRDSLITYYGISHHNEWVFTPLFRQ